jgi:outer membrane protein assembly factor BamA
VEPGEVFHVGKVVVSGLRAFPTGTLMQGGPKSGDVFSPARIGDWLEQVRNKYATRTRPLESVHIGEKIDYAKSQVDMEVMVKERN